MHYGRRIEQLARYIARPPIATTRLSLTASGKVLYKLKRRFKDGTHSVLMEPLAFLERLCSGSPSGHPPDAPIRCAEPGLTFRVRASTC